MCLIDIAERCPDNLQLSLGQPSALWKLKKLS